jgi:heterogeneous nuclear ribonucleoprotein R
MSSICSPHIFGSCALSKVALQRELFKMPRRTEDAAFAKPVEPEECLELDDHEEEVEEEEVEYEEIEEEVEEEVEDEDILEEVEESEEEEEEEEDPEEREIDDSGSKLEVVPQQVDAEDGNDKEKHAELLALPPHGSEVYIGGLSSSACSEDVKKLCEPVGEVAEVSTPTFLGLMCFSCSAYSPFFSALHILLFFLQVRIMQGKDYAFVTFRTKDLALKAIKKLNNSTFKVCFPLILHIDYHVLMSMNLNS